MLTHEQNLIGVLLRGGGAGDVFSQLEASELRDPDLRELYSRLREIWTKRGNCELGDLAGMPETLMKAGYYAYETMYSPDAQKAVDAVKTRNAVSKANELAGRISFSDDLSEIRPLADELVRAVQGEQRSESMTMRDGVLRFMQTKTAPRAYIKTGFSRLDQYAYMDKGDYVVIGARPSSGKTALAIQLAVQFARQDYRVGLFSLETSGEKIFDRLVSSVAKIHLGRIKRQNMDSGEWTRFAELSDRIAALPVTVIPASGKTVAWIQSEALRLSLDAVVIDYLGLIRSAGRDIREQVTRTSRDLHTFAQSNKRLVIALAQLNREGANRKPQLIDLRESGEIEENADLVLMIHNPPGEETFRDCSLIVAKNKDGVAGVEDEMTFEGRYQTFTEVERRHE